MRALFFDSDSGVWLGFTNPVADYSALAANEIPSVLERVCLESAREGLFAAGYISYEGASAFDGRLVAHPGDADLPPARFALFSSMSRHDDPAEFAKGEAGSWSVGPFVPELDESRYAEKIAVIRERLFAGDTYQVNFTFRLEAPFSGDPFGWFLALASAKPGEYLSYWEDDGFAVCSTSPELFFRKEGTHLTFKPMKGTAPYGPECGQDAASAAGTLRNCPKNRAENLMIVDMIRNDAGRVALPGTVKVPALYETETHPTLIQMTSTVTAETDADIPRIFASVFPCASITGAPKVRTMEIIRELEESNRGVYTGTLGFITPQQDCLFAVAIRTAVVDTRKKTARYGTGSGITWLSDDREEWNECLLKTRALQCGEPFHVFESLLLENGEYWLLEKHLARMERSCARFALVRDVPELMGRVESCLEKTAERNPVGRFKVRIHCDGIHEPVLACAPALSLPDPYTVALSSTSIDSGDPFIGHKTNRRQHIEKALSATAGQTSDVILVNDRGELTESSRANLIVNVDEGLFTPPVSSGLLPGVYRERLLEEGKIAERVLYREDFFRADGIFLCNSVRGLIECVPVY